MIQKTIRDTKFYGLLTALEKTDPAAAVFKGELLNAEQTAAPVLEYIKNDFPNFTEHGISHSIGIMEAVYDILPNDLLESMSPAEIYCFMMAALFHDMGMTTDDEADLDKRRAYHHLYAGKPVREYMKTRAAGMREAKRLTDCIVYASESHGKDIGSLYKENEFRDVDDVDGSCIRYGLITVLIRTGDLLDLEEGRTSEFNMGLNPRYYDDAISQEHHNRHLEVKRFHKTGTAIEIRIETANRQRYKIWRDWLNYLDQEIMYANTHYLPKLDRETGGTVIRYRLPEVSEELMAAAGSDFQVEEVKFQLDEKGILLDIITNSIYTYEFDYIRELVQNAIDAVLLKEYMNPGRKLDSASPRSWKVSAPVVAAYSAENNRLIVAENGIGMSETEVRNYLFRAADSGYRHKKQIRDFKFPAIARFGIGFAACITKIEEMEVETEAEGTDRVRVTLESGSMTAFIEREQNRDRTGTAISLTPKNPFRFQEFQDYLAGTFCCPGVEIIVIDLDGLEKLEERLGGAGDSGVWAERQADPFIRRIADAEKKREQTLKVYLEEKKILDTVFDYVQSKKSIEKIKSAVTECSIRLEVLYGLMEGNDSGDYVNRQRETLKKLERLLEQGEIHEARYRSVELREHHTDKMKVYSRPWLSIKNEQMKELSPFRTACLSLDSSFFVTDVQMDSGIPDPKGQGIVFIRCQITNPDLGIEWQSVHGFLYFEREIVKYLSSFQSSQMEKRWVVGVAEPEDTLEEYNYIEEDLENDMIWHEQEEHPEYLFDVAGIYDNQFMEYTQVPEYALGATENREGVNLLDSEIWIYHPDQAGVFKFAGSFACQDGICLNINPECIAPFGCCTAAVNLTAGARMELNVSRHEISRNVEQIETWVKTCGAVIQKEVLNQLAVRFGKLGIRYNKFLTENGREPSGNFEKLCRESAQSLLQDMLEK